jgi:hypothetical protein
MYFIIVGGLGNVSIGPEYISKKNHYLNFGCNSGSALCCYYYSLITRGKLPKKSKSLLLKSIEMKYPPERVYRDVAGIILYNIILHNIIRYTILSYIQYYPHRHEYH